MCPLPSTSATPPLTLAEALRLGTASLKKAGVESPALDMSLILAHAAGLTRLQVYTQSDRPLNSAEKDKARAMLARRMRREPLAYILDHKEFYGLTLKVTHDVLIPRPETELLVECAIQWLAANAPPEGSAPRVADIGTGSGAIALALAHACPAARLTATDLSPAALAVARQNAESLTLAGRIDFRHGSLLEPLLPAAGTEKFDAILSNPPYVPEPDRPSLAPEVREHEPSAALFSGPDGLDHLRAIIAQAPRCLRPGGLLALEFGFGQAEAMRALLASPAWAAPRLINDLAGIPRVAAACLA